VKVRQPLAEAVVVAPGRERDAIERFEAVLREELNVKRVRVVSQADELGRFELKPNYRALGPRFGKHMPQVAAAVGALDPQRAAQTLRGGGQVGVRVNGGEHALAPDDVQLVMHPLEGYELERAGTHAVALNLEVDRALLCEGRAREVVHKVQEARKDAGLKVEDRIVLRLGGDTELLECVRVHETYVAGETLATALRYDGAEDAHGFQIDGRELRVAVERS
jgi:isoleucyl-tRNA synthetase